MSRDVKEVWQPELGSSCFLFIIVDVRGLHVIAGLSGVWVTFSGFTFQARANRFPTLSPPLYFAGVNLSVPSAIHIFATSLTVDIAMLSHFGILALESIRSPCSKVSYGLCLVWIQFLMLRLLAGKNCRGKSADQMHHHRC